jgi:hypothetical protein
MKVVASLSDCSSDLILPVIILNGTNTININQGDVYTDLGATATDNKDGNVTSKITVTSNVNPSVPGSYTVIYSVTDMAGNKGIATRTVTVIDTVAPAIAFGTNGNATYAKSRSTTVTVTDVGGIDVLKYLWNTSTTTLTESSFTAATAFTNGGTITTPAGLNGTYYLWILSKDKANNITITRSNVFNLDNTAPVITVTGSNPVTVNKGSTYTDAGATVTDNADTTLTATATGTVNPNVIGTYTITYSATDSSENVAVSKTRTINVVDVSAPVITLLGSNTVTLYVGETYNDAGATALDDVDGNVTSKITTTSNVSTATIGTYTVTYTVKDNANNTATITRAVNVIAKIFTYSYTGNYQTFTVPRTGNYKIELWGASGSSVSVYSDTYGRGAYTNGVISLIENSNLYIYVGQIGLNYSAFNGGGYGESGGGGATDIRLISGIWNNFDSLKSRIMVAAGGGGGVYNGQPYQGTQRGDGGALNGISANFCVYSQCYWGYSGYGATQISGGAPGKVGVNPIVPEMYGNFGSGGYSPLGPPASGGGGGYYGGGHGTHPGGTWPGGGGGSSYISGYSGCNAISMSSTTSNIVHTGQPNHYSGYVFTSATMIAGNTTMPNPAGGTETGHDGNGYVKITYIQ